MSDELPDDAAKALMGDEPAERVSLLSEADIAKAKKQAKDKVDAALRKAEFDRIVEEEILRIQREEGKRTGTRDKDEPVKIMIDLPEFCTCIRINMEPYWHGHTYDVPRHVAEGLREIMARTWDHQHILDGKNMTERFNMVRNVSISGKEMAA
jgi:hypothetical protein